MRIWHIGALSSPHRVDGTNVTVWQLAREQALLDHQVALLLDDQPDEAAVTLTEQTGLKLLRIPTNMWHYKEVLESLLRSEPPEVLHVHRVFVPKQAILERSLAEYKIPSVVTPHGAIDFQRRRARKRLYVWLVEKSRFYRASAVTVVAPQEEKAVRAVAPGYGGIVRWIPNPIDTHSLEEHSWKGNTEEKRLIFLGRFHVVHKGIDILVDIARFAPSVEFRLYGVEDIKTKGMLQRLKRRLPPNVYFHGPVFGAEKTQALVDASLYIQASRWEGFPISVAEAMYLGVPCAVAPSLYQAELFRQQNLGLVLPLNPKEAATRLLEVLAQPTQLQGWSERARAYARAHFSPRSAALSYLKLYEEVLYGCKRPSSH
jgi:glycosyltransferase involved in cell wall biosynthesis